MEMGLEHQGTANTTAPSHEGLCSPLGISYSYAQLGSYMLKSAQRAQYLSASPLLSAQWPSITKVYCYDLRESPAFALNGWHVSRYKYGCVIF